MQKFDYGVEAELFPSRARPSRRQPVGYKKFATAAEAIRFAIEDLPAEFLAGTWLEVDEARFNAQEIRQLYDRDEFPLPRQHPVSPKPGNRSAAGATPRGD